MNRRSFSKIFPLAVAGMSIRRPAQVRTHAQPTDYIKPKPLKKGDTIGLITPASSASQESMVKAIENIHSLGYKVKLGPHTNKNHGFLAGKDKERLEDFHTLLTDEEVSGLWYIRGGYGSVRLLPHLDYPAIRSLAKPIIGYSDATALHLGILTHAGLKGIHGPVASSDFTEYAKNNLFPLLERPHAGHLIKSYNDGEDDRYQVQVISAGSAEGRLLGGNLTVFTSLCGTPFFPDCKGAILFLEDIGEEPYRLDRYIQQLKLNIDFHSLSGIVLGHFTNCEPKNNTRSLTIQDTFQEAFEELTIPIMSQFSFGHISNQCSFPMGSLARINTDKQEISLI